MDLAGLVSLGVIAVYIAANAVYFYIKRKRRIKRENKNKIQTLKNDNSQHKHSGD